MPDTPKQPIRRQKRTLPVDSTCSVKYRKAQKKARKEIAADVVTVVNKARYPEAANLETKTDPSSRFYMLCFL